MSCKARPKFVDLQFTPHLTFDKLCVRPCRQSSRGLSLVLVVCTGLLCLSDWQTVNCVSVNRSSPAQPPLPTLETPNISVHCRLHSDTSPPLAPPSLQRQGLWSCSSWRPGRCWGEAGERPGRGLGGEEAPVRHLYWFGTVTTHGPSPPNIPLSCSRHAACRLQTADISHMTGGLKQRWGQRTEARWRGWWVFGPVSVRLGVGWGWQDTAGWSSRAAISEPDLSTPPSTALAQLSHTKHSTPILCANCLQATEISISKFISARLDTFGVILRGKVTLQHCSSQSAVQLFLVLL